MQPQILPLTLNMNYGGSQAYIHPVLLRDEQNTILIDCGFTGSLPMIEGEIARHGLRADMVTGIVLTHHDHDHMGAAAAFQSKYRAVKLYASALEEPYISAAKKPLRLLQAEALQKTLPPEQQAFGEAFCGLLRSVEPAQVDAAVQGGQRFDWCGGCEIIATPGHTPGHISLYLPFLRTIIAGDAVALENGTPVIANPQFTLDMEQAVASMNRLLAMGGNRVVCYHGGMYEREVVKA